MEDTRVEIGRINRMMMGISENRFSPFVILGLFFILYFYPYLVQGKTMLPFHMLYWNPAVLQEEWLTNASMDQVGVGYDLVSQFYPWKEKIRRGLLEGYIPLWNSLNLGGMPFLANIQTGCFYPANLLLLFFDTSFAITLMAVFNMLVAALGTYYYLRTLRAERMWACLGAIGFIQSGYMVHWFQWVPHNGAIAWFPFMLVFTHRAVRQWRPKWIILAQASGALSIFSGHVQFSFYAFVAISLYAVLIAASGDVGNESRLPRRLLRAACFLATLGVGVWLLALCQLLPSLELTRHSLRGREVLDALRADTLIGVQALQLWSRSLLGSYDSVNGWGGYSLGLDNPYVPLFLSGVLIHAVLSGRVFKRDLLPLAVVAVLALVVSFGQRHVFALISHVPFFDHFRSPSRFGYIAVFGAVCLSVPFLSGLWVKAKQGGRIGPLESLPYASTAVTFTLLAGLLLSSHRFEAPHGHVLSEVIKACVFLAVYQVTLMAARIKKFALCLPLVFIILGSAEVIVTNYGFNPKTQGPSSGILRLNPSIEELGRDGGTGGRLIKVSDTPNEDLYLYPNLGMLHDIPSIHGHNTFITKKYAHFFEGIDNESFSSYASDWNHIRNIEPGELESPSLRLLGVRYVLSSVDLSGKYKELGSLGWVRIYELDDAIPRVFLIPPGLAGDTTVSHEEVLDEAGELVGSYDVKVTKIPNGYRAELHLEESARVVLGEMHYPGWRAWVNGEESTVKPVAGGLISTHLDAGEHVVRFEFRPRSFFASLALSALAWGLAIGYLVYEPWSQRVRRLVQA